MKQHWHELTNEKQTEWLNNNQKIKLYDKQVEQLYAILKEYYEGVTK